MCQDGWIFSSWSGIELQKKCNTTFIHNSLTTCRARNGDSSLNTPSLEIWSNMQHSLSTTHWNLVNQMIRPWHQWVAATHSTHFYCTVALHMHKVRLVLHTTADSANLLPSRSLLHCRSKVSSKMTMYNKFTLMLHALSHTINCTYLAKGSSDW